jgi:predicted esterase
MLLAHGRGANAESILALAHEFPHPGMAYLAPQAAEGSWYPYLFLQPMERNAPWLSAALGVLEATLGKIQQAGIPAARAVLLGFSQGARLALEFAARHAQRYGAVIGFSGGLIGPAGTPRAYAGSLAGTPVFLGCSDVDAHIPAGRVTASAEVFTRLGAVVTARLYANLGHTLNHDEIKTARKILESLGNSRLETGDY